MMATKGMLGGAGSGHVALAVRAVSLFFYYLT